MINHKEQFKRVQDTFKKVEEEYNKFRKDTSYENRNILKNKINKHRKSLINLMLSINNLFLK